MPRRKQDVAGAWGMLAILFWPALAWIIGVVAFILILVSYIYFQLRCLRLPKELTIDYLFDAPAERARLRSEIADLERKIETLWDKGLRAGLEPTKDDKFDARKPEARRLNRQMAEFSGQLESARNRLGSMNEVARSRSDNWSWHRAGRLGSLVALTAYVATAVLLGALSPTITPAWLKFISACSAVVCGGIAWFYKGHSVFDEPAPEVDMNAEPPPKTHEPSYAENISSGYNGVITKGDTIRARWSGDGQTYNAHVDQIHGDTISVTWEDGYSEDISRSDVLDMLSRGRRVADVGSNRRR